MPRVRDEPAAVRPDHEAMGVERAKALALPQLERVTALGAARATRPCTSRASFAASGPAPTTTAGPRRNGCGNAPTTAGTSFGCRHER